MKQNGRIRKAGILFGLLMVLPLGGCTEQSDTMSSQQETKENPIDSLPVFETQEEELNDVAENGNESQLLTGGQYDPVVKTLVKNPGFEYYYAGEQPKESTQRIFLNKINEITGNQWNEDTWMDENGFEPVYLPIYDETYIYDLFENGLELVVSERGTNRVIADLDFSEFQYGVEILPEDRDYVEQKILFAKVEEKVLYVATGHLTYAKSCPQTAYVTAISLENFEVLWKSQPLCCNSYNFQIVDGTIITGYGFTEEEDYIYLIDMQTGNIWEKIPIASKASYLFCKQNTLYVIEYDRMAQFEIQYLSDSKQSDTKNLLDRLQEYCSKLDEPEHEANEYLENYQQNVEKEYNLSDSSICYRMAVGDAALGNRFYVLLKSLDQGIHWYVMSDNPFSDAMGGSVDFVFLNEAVGFATLSHNGGAEATLYITHDGGKNYTEVEWKDNPVVELSDGTTDQPYDFPKMPFVEDDAITVYVGQGDDGDYDGGDDNKMARFVSTDAGKSFLFDGYGLPD